jgi:hypothetical protein
MGGGLMQLVAYGAQDVYLTGNPQITFFKVVYRRHTNFSMEYIRQTPNGSKSSQSITIGRNGDLIYDIFIEKTGGDINVPAMVEIEIGGQLIDRQDKNFIKTYLELTEKNPNGCQNSLLQRNLLGGKNRHARIPLTFWFCRNPGVAIPLIALQYHEVKLNVEDPTHTSLDTNIYWVNYIYLDTDERRRFAQVSHEYLIEQVQMQTDESIKSGQNTYDLIFNHPVKELIWTIPKDSRNLNNTWQLKLNGQDRFSKMDQNYFTRLQTWKYHSGSSLVKANSGPTATAIEDYRVQSGISNNVNTDRIHVYSFALKPEEHQPSGTCNFSRIDSSRLIHYNAISTTSSSKLNIYAINYNVLRVMSGMGGLAYSN